MAMGMVRGRIKIGVPVRLFQQGDEAEKSWRYLWHFMDSGSGNGTHNTWELIDSFSLGMSGTVLRATASSGHRTGVVTKRFLGGF
jgi:hypothetical protein